jgi:ADP-ribose pyrophosphatase YjhB (NUDIX family)
VTRGRAPGLLGTYPVPALRLVGSDPAPGPRSPSRWRPGQPPPQYGIDYSFTRRRGRTPVRWRSGAAITVRLTGLGSADPVLGDPVLADTVVAETEAVVRELRELTGLELRLGQQPGGLTDVRDVPDQEIHVAFLESARVQQIVCLGARPTGDPDRPRFADARPGPDGLWYQRGWALIDAGLVAELAGRSGDQATSPAARITLLRHQLSHALGLGHAARPSLLMHRRIPVDLGGYGRGDRHGLARLGGTGPDSGNSPQPSPIIERTLPCGQ